MSDSFIAIGRNVSKAASFANRTLLLFVALTVAACGKTPQERLEGKWVGGQIDNVSADHAVRATAWAKATTLEFAGDKLTVTIPAETPRKGTFQIAKAEGDKVVLSVARPGTAIRDQVAFTLLQGDKSMRWDIGDNREVTLVRGH